MSELYFETLVFALYFNFGLSIVKIKKIKFGLLPSHLQEHKEEHGGWNEPQCNDKF